MESKLRQIHRFVEILSHLVDGWDRGSGRIRVVDLGCGKGYLTFAAYQWLRASGWPQAEVLGIELRPALVETCSRIAREVGYDGLAFRAGEIAHTPFEGADVAIALHACDTATDDALAAGVEAGARLLIVAPCCHREVRPQLAPPVALAALGAHGILVEREAELVTDALRAAALESAGFAARVFEFVSTEHTAKNLMIAAERTGKVGDPARVRDLAAFFGVGSQRLADRLGIALG
jgi:SAM-dependent methyltransferase